jgi:DNA polymerase III delta' subunit
VDGARTRGHGPALAAIEAMVRGAPPHAILLSGPGGVGKTTLALDLAAGLLCTADDPTARPCRTCRGCRLVDHGDHPDLHRLAPEGPGGQIVMGGSGAPYRGVRDLIADLALLPLEGGARVAIVESAHRMNEDAQAALLKTLEEPPSGVTIVLCADDEARLLPTVRSRCARIRLGPVGPRDIEAILADRQAADPPTAARLGRMVGGRPGIALAYAHAPDALRLRGELGRTLLDLLDATPADRLAAMRTAMPEALALAADLERGAAATASVADADPTAGDGPATTGRRTRAKASSAAAARAPKETSASSATTDDADPDEADPDAPVRAVPAALRRRAAEALVLVWTEVARDLALVAAGGAASVHDPAMLEETMKAAAGLPPDAAVAALRRLERAGMLIAANVSPELVLDALAIAWPRRQRTTAA